MERIFVYFIMWWNLWKDICLYTSQWQYFGKDRTNMLFFSKINNNKTRRNYQLYFITNDKIYPKIWCDPMIGNAIYHLSSIKYTSLQKYVCINEFFFSFLCFFIFFFFSNFTYIVDLTYNTPNETRHGKLKIFF